MTPPMMMNAWMATAAVSPAASSFEKPSCASIEMRRPR